MTDTDTVTIVIDSPEVVTLPIDAIKPYWRNPRKITDEQVAKVRDSIQRYGYQQPILVDRKHVVIAGHTRLQALRQMGVTELPVVVSPMSAKKAKEYRIIDNRTSEYGQWDTDKLLVELREFSAPVIDLHFPHFDLSLEGPDLSGTSQADMDRAAANLDRQPGGEASSEARTIQCPHCFQTITLET